MTDPRERKAVLRHYLQVGREALLWKEIDYFGDAFGREWPTPEERVTDQHLEADPQADWYATEDETCAGIIDLYRRVWAFADATIEELPLDALGRVPWWREDRNPVTLDTVMVHVTVGLARHVGHADILREQIDGAVGVHPRVPNLPEQQDWAAYVAKLTALAERF